MAARRSKKTAPKTSVSVKEEFWWVSEICEDCQREGRLHPWALLDLSGGRVRHKKDE